MHLYVRHIHARHHPIVLSVFVTSLIEIYLSVTFVSVTYLYATYHRPLKLGVYATYTCSSHTMSVTYIPVRHTHARPHPHAVTSLSVTSLRVTANNVFLTISRMTQNLIRTCHIYLSGDHRSCRYRHVRSLLTTVQNGVLCQADNNKN